MRAILSESDMPPNLLLISQVSQVYNYHCTSWELNHNSEVKQAKGENDASYFPPIIRRR